MTEIATSAAITAADMTGGIAMIAETGMSADMIVAIRDMTGITAGTFATAAATKSSFA